MGDVALLGGLLAYKPEDVLEWQTLNLIVPFRCKANFYTDWASTIKLMGFTSLKDFD